MRSASAAGRAGPDAHGTTNLDAGIGALDLGESGTVGRTDITGAGALQWQQFAAGCMIVRLLADGRIGQRGRCRQRRNGDRKQDFSHCALYRRTARAQTGQGHLRPSRGHSGEHRG